MSDFNPSHAEREVRPQLEEEETLYIWNSMEEWGTRGGRKRVRRMRRMIEEEEGVSIRG